MDPHDISISEGGEKRYKLLSSSPKSVESDQPAVDSNEMAIDSPGNADGFSDLFNRGDVNKNGTHDDMGCAAMGQKEVQY